MDPLGVGFIVLVALAGGLIAFLADRLGRHIGKKRKSLLGLRPRHTAELLIVGAGVLIPIATILLVMAASQEVRQWFLEGRAAIGERDRLRADVADLERNRQSLEQDIESGRNLLQELEKRLADARDEIDSARSQVAALRAEVDRKAEEGRKLDRELRTTMARLTTVGDELTAKRTEFDSLSATYETLYAQTQEERQRNLQLDRQNNQLERDIETARRSIEDLQQQLANLSDQRDLAVAQRQGLQQSLDILVEDFETLKRESEEELERNRRLLAQVQEELSTNRELLARLRGSVDANLLLLRTQPLIFSQETELARLSIGPTITRLQAQTFLNALLSQADETARRRGAAVSGEFGSAAPLVPIQFENRLVTVEEQRQNLLESMVGLPDGVAIVAYAAWNTFRGEYVPLVIRIFQNPVVFTEGQVIAEARVDARRSEVEIVNEIVETLLGQVRARAQQEKMIPRQGSDEPYGSVSSQELLNIVRLVKNESGPVRVQALVAKDTRAADPLQLQFRMR